MAGVNPAPQEHPGDDLFRSGFFEDFGEGDGDAAAAFAFVGGFHEGHDFEGGRGGDGADAGLKKLHDFDGEAVVVLLLAGGGDALGANGGDAVAFEGFAVALRDADAAIGPDAGEDVGIRGVGAGDGDTAGAEDGEEGFDAVDAIPVEIRMVGFKFGGSDGVNGGDVADLGELGGEGLGGVAEGGGAKDRHAGLAGETDNFDGVFQ